MPSVAIYQNSLRVGYGAILNQYLTFVVNQLMNYSLTYFMLNLCMHKIASTSKPVVVHRIRFYDGNGGKANQDIVTGIK